MNNFPDYLMKGAIIGFGAGAILGVYEIIDNSKYEGLRAFFEVMDSTEDWSKQDYHMMLKCAGIGTVFGSVVGGLVEKLKKY